MINVTEKIERSRAPYVQLFEKDLAKMKVEELMARRRFLTDKLDDDLQNLIGIKNENEESINFTLKHIGEIKKDILLKKLEGMENFTSESKYRDGVFQCITKETALMTTEAHLIDSILSKRKTIAVSALYYGVGFTIVVLTALAIVFFIPKNNVVGIAIVVAFAAVVLEMARRHHSKARIFYK